MNDSFRIIFFFAAKEMRWKILHKIFDQKQISSLQQLVDSKVASVDEISDKLIKFGNITQNNRVDALLSVYSSLLKGIYFDGLF